MHGDRHGILSEFKTFTSATSLANRTFAPAVSGVTYRVRRVVVSILNALSQDQLTQVLDSDGTVLHKEYLTAHLPRDMGPDFGFELDVTADKGIAMSTENGTAAARVYWSIVEDTR